MPELTVEEIIDFAVENRSWNRDQAINIVKGLMEHVFWSPEAIALGIRANFCCEYCGRDLLASVDDFKLWERDHISRKTPPDNSLENLALACLLCNTKLKSRWSPPEGTRSERIQAVANYVSSLRNAKAEELDRVRKLVGATRV